MAGQPLPWLTNLGNLQYDARVPVFSSYFTNVTPWSNALSETNLGRYYLDLNRNGMFEFSDAVQAGDPHWLGILEYPDQPHGPTNRFSSRYTYLTVPAGKTLDLNLIHNQAKRIGAVNSEGYYRNLGHSPYEFNLAALLTEAFPGHYRYTYDTNFGLPSAYTPAGQDPFRDALSLLLFRNNNSYNSFSKIGRAHV